MTIGGAENVILDEICELVVPPFSGDSNILRACLPAPTDLAHRYQGDVHVHTSSVRLVQDRYDLAGPSYVNDSMAKLQSPRRATAAGATVMYMPREIVADAAQHDLMFAQPEAVWKKNGLPALAAQSSLQPPVGWLSEYRPVMLVSGGCAGASGIVTSGDFRCRGDKLGKYKSVAEVALPETQVIMFDIWSHSWIVPRRPADDSRSIMLGDSSFVLNSRHSVIGGCATRVGMRWFHFGGMMIFDDNAVHVLQLSQKCNIRSAQSSFVPLMLCLTSYLDLETWEWSAGPTLQDPRAFMSSTALFETTDEPLIFVQGVCLFFSPLLCCFGRQ